ncbi:MAG TPA: hypothetical protein VMF11_01365 [Candidatus Baltobacteraceae bacterium]|nr:hypothetical protein [Candidatus Baltobacteraceae bacterium]
MGFQGEITSVRSGGYTLWTSSSGYLPITTTSSTTTNTDGGTATVGHYALVVGTGSTSVSISAIYVATFTTDPGAVTMSGTYSGATTYGIEIETSAHGVVPVMVSSATKLSGSLTVGGAVTVAGNGTPDGILATTVTGSGAAPASTSTPASGSSTISQEHVITADYLGSPWGSTTVSAAEAAPHLTWAETGVANTNSFAAAGIKTMVYADMLRVQSTDPLYAKLSGSEYAETCSGARVSDYFDDVTQYIPNPSSSGMRAAADAVIASELSGHTVDAIFEDDANPLSQDAASYFTVGMPCDYSDSTWIAGEEELFASYGYDTFVNGFSHMTSSDPITNTTQLLANSTTIGGNMESCYVADTSSPEQDGWVWTATENTSLLVTNEDKDFMCWAMDYTSAASAVRSRLYVLASFLMTYNPAYSILREEYGTASGLHVMPESQLVPTEPVVAQPSTVASLEKSDVYVREYRACYYAGKLVGQCAMVVNNGTTALATPALTLTYAHTLTLSGAGVLDGGTVGFDGAAPPSSIAAESAFVALR